MNLTALLLFASFPTSAFARGETQFVELTPDPGFAESIHVAQAQESTDEKKPDIHYVPTPPKLVDAMLDMAKVGDGDVVYDLGSGDGRMVITAAKRRARGIGIDIDPKMIAEAEKNAEDARVQDRVKFRREDLFASDFSDASVITLYLLEDLNRKLRPRIFDQVKPGTRVVSHAFRMGEWEPDQERQVDINGSEYNAYFWVVPANMSGRWKVQCPDNTECPETVEIDQQFQKITVRDGAGQELGRGRVDGDRFSFTRERKGRLSTFRGKAEGDLLEASGDGKTWRATREQGTRKPIDPAASVAASRDI